jgi:hypothetical protein
LGPVQTDVVTAWVAFGEDPSRLPPPESIADAFLALALALPTCTRNGDTKAGSAASSVSVMKRIGKTALLPILFDLSRRKTFRHRSSQC